MRRNQHGIDHILVPKNDFLRKIPPARLLLLLLADIFRMILKYLTEAFLAPKFVS
jgi:hypothetical protein